MANNEPATSNTAIVAIIVIAVAAILFLFFFKPWGERAGETPALIEKNTTIEKPSTSTPPASR